MSRATLHSMWENPCLRCGFPEGHHTRFGKCVEFREATVNASGATILLVKKVPEENYLGKVAEDSAHEAATAERKET